MKIYVGCKEYFKESKEVQKAIISGVMMLYGRIQNYEEQNITFSLLSHAPCRKYGLRTKHV